MAGKIARLIHITYEDGETVEYEHVFVQEVRHDRNLKPDAVPEKYWTLTVTEKNRRITIQPPSRPNPTTGVKSA